jgi:hypothetical protein
MSWADDRDQRRLHRAAHRGHRSDATPRDADRAPRRRPGAASTQPSARDPVGESRERACRLYRAQRTLRRRTQRHDSRERRRAGSRDAQQRDPDRGAHAEAPGRAHGSTSSGRAGRCRARCRNGDPRGPAAPRPQWLDHPERARAVARPRVDRVRGRPPAGVVLIGRSARDRSVPRDPRCLWVLHLAVERGRSGGAQIPDLDFVPVRQA